MALINAVTYTGWQLALFILVGAIAVSQPVTAVVNWICTLFIRPNPLPRLDFSAGIPSEDRTIVVVPTMLSNIKGVDELIEGLEVRFVANHGKNIHFALLTDFTDADAQHQPDDETVIEPCIERD